MTIKNELTLSFSVLALLPTQTVMLVSRSLACILLSNASFILSETGPSKLSVGKIFGGMLILENWKLTRFTQNPHMKKSLVPVSYNLFTADYPNSIVVNIICQKFPIE